MIRQAIPLKLVRSAPGSTEDLLTLLFEGLDWPLPPGMTPEEVPLLPWSPEELHLNPQAVAKLSRIQQLPALTDQQPFGVFILTFEGGRLPIGAVRRVVNQLVRKQRARRHHAGALWDVEDLVFFCQSGGEVDALHVVAFRDTGDRPVLKVISWDRNATPQRLDLVAQSNLPALRWPDDTGDLEGWRSQWLDGFTATYRQGIGSAKQLAVQMADVAVAVREEVAGLLDIETDDGPFRSFHRELRETLRADLDRDGFADLYAQTTVYGLLTARLTNPEAFTPERLDDALTFDNPLLDALYHGFQQRQGDHVDVDEFGLRDLAETLASTDVDQVLADFGVAERKDDPVVFFYEEFLERYDPKQRRDLGAYYTPIPVVRAMIRAVDHILKRDLDLPGGVADDTTWAQYAARTGTAVPDGCDPDSPVVRTIDPATGTGTFLIEWLRHSTAGGGDPAAALERADAFEISLSAYAVAHLKVSLEATVAHRTDARPNILLTDTLAGEPPRQQSMFDNPIAEESQRAQRVKFSRRHSVVIGNPPYDRVERDGAGGWITEGHDGNGAPFADFLDPARKHTIFSHQASLYNLYVYFWRWAMWKAFEQSGSGPAVAAFITASSWLTGPGFLGMRQVARELADDIYVIDLGGDNLGARTDENVFPIQTPVAITVLVRHSAPNATSAARARYHRVEGTRAEKLNTLEALDTASICWEASPEGWHAPLKPPTGATSWGHYPALTALLPWQQPGAMLNRTWPIAPDPAALKERWQRFVATADPDDRARCFVTPKTGRNIHTKVGDLPRLADLPVGAPHQPITRYAYRSFDRQWTFHDPRLAALERPHLWASRSPQQLFMSSLMTAQLGLGPAATATTAVPDKHHFHGRGGKDVIPLYRDADGTPNADPATLQALTTTLRQGDPDFRSVTVEDLFAYLYGVLAGADYTSRFADELETPGPRIPLTADPDLFARMAEHGQHLLWLHTYAERFTSPDRPDHLPIPDHIAWQKPVSTIPQRPGDWRYDPETETLHLGGGALSGVRPDVWDFEVSGMPIVRKWLGYRTLDGAGKSRSSDSPLDHIRPTRWADEWNDELRELVYVLTETLDLLPDGVALLDEIVAGPLIAAEVLPTPPESLTKPPKVNRSGAAQLNYAPAATPPTDLAAEGIAKP